MTLESTELQIGGVVYVVKMSPAGNAIHRGGRVVDLNEQMKCAKVEYQFHKSKVKREWFSLEQLTLRPEPEPKEETKTV